MSKKRNVMDEFELDEISGVDCPAQEGGLVTIMKRGPVEKKLRLLSDEEGHTHVIDDNDEGGQTSYEHSTGEEMGHSHPWVRNDDGSITIGMSDGHTHKVIQKSHTAGDAGSQGPDMTNTNGAAGEQAVTKEQLTAVQAELQLAKAYGELTDAQKTYANKLSAGAERNAFINMPVEKREALVKAAVSEDPIEYTCLDGTVIRKSAGELVAKLARQADEATRQLAAEKVARSNERLEKRAGQELNHLPGDVTVKVALLRAVEGIADESVRKSVGDILKAANEFGAPAFKSIGSAAANADVTDAEAKLEELANKRAVEKGEDFSKAYAAILATPEGRALYAKTR